MGEGSGAESLADAREIIKNVVNLPTNEEPLDNIKQSHITAKTLLPDTYPVGDWLRRVYIITLENYGIIKDLAPTRPGGEPITGILLLLKFFTVLTTSWSALSTCTVEGFRIHHSSSQRSVTSSSGGQSSVRGSVLPTASQRSSIYTVQVPQRAKFRDPQHR